jgi:methylenetetrahydrofolate--tRNA-(uracil-5-)-methyltransferase
LLASLSAVSAMKGERFVPPPRDTGLGVLLNYVTEKRGGSYQPMNINYGLFNVAEMKMRDKKARNQKVSDNARSSLGHWQYTQALKAGSTN